MYLKTWFKSNKKIAIFALLSILFITALFISFTQKLTQYKCKDSSSATHCFGCEVSKHGEKVDFLVNKNNQTVMQRTFVKIRGEAIVTSDLYDNCKIFDAKNWDCSNSFMSSNGNYHNTHSVMAGNVFSYYSKLNHKDNSGTAWCAK